MTDAIQLTMADVLSCRNITRWHQVSHTNPQTLADHQWCVAINAIYIGRAVQVEYPLNMTHLILLALTHDAEESVWGDIPRPSKRVLKKYIPDAKLPLELIELTAITPLYRDIIKLADLVDGLMFIKEKTRDVALASSIEKHMDEILGGWDTGPRETMAKAVLELIQFYIGPLTKESMGDER